MAIFSSVFGVAWLAGSFSVPPKRDESQQTPASMIFQRVVGGDAIEPSLERKLRVRFEDALIRFEERVLGQVVGDLAICGHPQHVPKNRRLILFDGLAEDISLPGADLIYDPRFVQRWRYFDMSLDTIIPKSAKTGTG